MMSSDTSIKYRTLFFIIVLNFILQSAIFQAIKINDVSANMALVIVVIATILYGLESGMFVAILAGLFIDVFLSMAIGINLFIFVIIAVLISFIGKPLFTGNKFTLVLLASVSTFIYHLMYFFFMYFLNKGIEFSRVIHVVPIEMILNSIACIIIYHYAIKWIERHKLD